MFLKANDSGDLIRIEDLNSLFSPLKKAVSGRDQAGEEEQDEAEYAKDKLVFPSGEPLPKCWTDPNFQIAKCSSSAKS